MSKLGTQQDYWNGRAQHWNALSPPLLPSKPDLDFVHENMRHNGHTLILGVTPELCTMALASSHTVTAVDFAQHMIDALRIEGVTYVCDDWIAYLGQNAGKFDTIITDGGLTCLAFPEQWQRFAEATTDSLKPNGVFIARVFMTTGKPPKDSYDNPSLERFVTSMGKVNKNWMVHPQHGDYENFDMAYAFPPEKEVLSVFDGFTTVSKLVPSYEEGERFVSYSWRRP